ncbi:aromatic amino acid lyase [Amycolatopsis magusensis]|uniref:aromatic amino acid lyase n=1 Tax=Amycolatopsis magusensis TaxID=882444 RepID=UPI0024A9BEE8|nr:aromatic amino acid ammonia-lyase [Amycolatopsis magusensis]MDI5980597.1 aromatic amino acid ammonia-lyase [Amycolatopsis magusensis]
MSSAEKVSTRRELAELIRGADPGVVLEDCTASDLDRMRESSATVDKALAAGLPVYGLTRGFGPLVRYPADSELEQGRGMIAHLGTGQGPPLDPAACRLIVRLRLNSMRKGYSAVSPVFWQRLAGLWNRGFVPAIPREGTVSASGDLQPLAAAALAYSGSGEAWVRNDQGVWSTRPASLVLAELGAEPLEWPVREALAFVNGTGASLAVAILNHESVLRLARAVAVLTGRLAGLLRVNPEPYQPAIGVARGQRGQLEAAEWLRRALPPALERDEARPLQEPYSLRCAPQVLGAALDQLDSVADVLAREARGCTDNPITSDGVVLHGGNFHAMPVGFASDLTGLVLHQVAYLAERQLAVLCDPVLNGGLPPMLTPRPGRACGLAGVQLSATSFVAKIRQLGYPASLTSLPTNGWNQDHVPMALNGANSVAEAAGLAWLVVGSLAVGIAQLDAMSGGGSGTSRPWPELAALSPPLEADRPMAAEVRAAGKLLADTAAELLAREHGR